MFNYFTSHWVKVLDDLLQGSEPLVMVTVVKVEGSAPRSSGSRMLVFKDHIIETIGGGNLELEVISLARKMLSCQSPGENSDTAAGNRESQDPNNYRLELYGLGPALQQCCGGAVTIAFEKLSERPQWLNQSLSFLHSNDSIAVTHFDKAGVRREFFNSISQLGQTDVNQSLVEKFNPLSPDVVIFGAGHVGAALVSVLASLPFTIHWVDERSELFPQSLPHHVSVYNHAPWKDLIKLLPDNALNIVLTHSHELDENLCFEYLNGKAFYFLGLIGSKTKRARFLHRLRDRGIVQDQLNRLTCPIGVPEVTGNTPPEIAVGVAAQLLAIRDKIKLDNALHE